PNANRSRPSGRAHPLATRPRSGKQSHPSFQTPGSPSRRRGFSRSGSASGLAIARSRTVNTFSGSFVALVTPFADGRIDEPALRHLVDWHVGQGSHGLVPVVTTGESPTLDAHEHRRVVEVVVEQAAGRIPIMAGAGSNNTREALEFDRHAAECGADAVLHVTAYYNRPSQRGIVAHFEALDAQGG